MDTADLNNTLQTQFLKIFLYLGSSWILYILIFLSVCSIAIALERAWHFYKDQENWLGHQATILQLLKSQSHDALQSFFASKKGHIASILQRSMEGFSQSRTTVEQLAGSQILIEKMQMERGLAFLGTLGNNAPFIGLFGTVLGIIRAFRDLSVQGSGGSTAVMEGIAEALVATAVGLLVALPAVAIYNYFQRKIKKYMTTSDILVRLILAYAPQKEEGNV